jgi:hypothetical protein
MMNHQCHEFVQKEIQASTLTQRTVKMRSSGETNPKVKTRLNLLQKLNEMGLERISSTNVYANPTPIFGKTYYKIKII